MSVGLNGRDGATKEINLNFFFLFFPPLCPHSNCSSNPHPAHHHLSSVITATSAPPVIHHLLLSLAFCHFEPPSLLTEIASHKWGIFRLSCTPPKSIERPELGPLREYSARLPRRRDSSVNVKPSERIADRAFNQVAHYFPHRL